MAKQAQDRNPFTQLFSELNAPLCGPWKQTAAQYLNTSEEWAQKAIEWNEKATAWAKDTPLASLFETQRTMAQQVVEASTAMARRLWQIETKGEEKSA